MAKAFGNLAREIAGGVLQCPTKFSTVDNSGTPKNSPLAYSSSVITLTPPDDAVQLILTPSTNLQVSELIGMGSYYVITAGATHAMPVASMAAVYVKRDSADGTLNFRFVRV